MTEQISIGRALRIRERSLDEFWLQDQIVANPGCLGLGDLEVVYRERRQTGGGRLDILLKDPEEDSMFEVEVMLGETDESHIIPLFEANGQLVLHFVKVLDTYEEPEEGEPGGYEVHDEPYWRQKAAWVVDVAKALQGTLSSVLTGSSLRYLKSYIAISDGQNNIFWLHKRGSGKTLLNFWIPVDLVTEIAALLDQEGVPYTKKPEKLKLAVDSDMIREQAETFRHIGEVVKQAWAR